MLVSELVCERSSYEFLHVGFLGWFLGRMYFTCLILLVNLYTGTFFLCKDFFKCKTVTLIKSDIYTDKDERSLCLCLPKVVSEVPFLLNGVCAVIDINNREDV